MSTVNKNTQTQQSCLTDVKCRFFAQYWGQRLVAHIEDLGIKGVKDVRYETRTVINFKEIETSCLVLKPLSNYTVWKKEKKKT